MIDLNTSKAHRYSNRAILRVMLNNINHQPSNKHAFSNKRDSANLLEIRTRYINESSYDLSIITSNGLVIDLPPDNTWNNRLVVAITIQWGEDCEINKAAIRAQMPGVSEDIVNSLMNSIRNDPHEYGTQELDLFHVIELDSFESQPQGIWIEDLNVQLVDKQYAHRATFFTREAFYRSMPDLDEGDELIYGTGIGIRYFTSDPNITEPLYMFFGNDAITIKPTYMVNMATGIYINLAGNAEFAASSIKRKSLYISPEDYENYGIYKSARDIIELLKRERGINKERLEKLLKTYERYHPKDEIHRRHVRDIYLTDDVTLGDVFDLISELGKVEQVFSRAFK